MKKRSGISPLLGVMILIGLSLVGALFLNDVSTKVLQTSFSDLEYTITDLRIEKDSIGGCYFTVSLQNTGSVSITNTNVKTTLDSGDDEIIFENNIPIDPLSSFKDIKFFDATSFTCGNFTTSNTYSVQINATSNDSTFATLIPIKIKEIGTT